MPAGHATEPEASRLAQDLIPTFTGLMQGSGLPLLSATVVQSCSTVAQSPLTQRAGWSRPQTRRPHEHVDKPTVTGTDHSAAVPTLLRAGPYRFFIVMADCAEPRRVHASGGGGEAKIWLAPVRITATAGYSRNEFRARAGGTGP